MRKITFTHEFGSVFVTSDTHFGHKFMASKRGFKHVDAHDAALVDSWNDVVPANGLVFVLGDVSFASKHDTYGIIQRLHGQKFVIPGNHDSTKNLEYWFGAENILPQLIRIQVIDSHDSTDRLSFEASHYPLASWNGSDHGSLHLHGHLHSTNNRVSHHYCAPYEGAGTRYDIGIDNAGFFGTPGSPIPLSVVRTKFEQERILKNARRKPRAEIGWEDYE